MCAGYAVPLFNPFAETLSVTSDAVRDSVTSPVTPELFFAVNCIAIGAAAAGAGVTGAGAGAGMAAGSAACSVCASGLRQPAMLSETANSAAPATFHDRFILTSALNCKPLTLTHKAVQSAEVFDESLH